MARSVAAVALAAILGCAGATHLPTTLFIKSINSSAAVINMTDDLSYGTISWKGGLMKGMRIADDVTVTGELDVPVLRWPKLTQTRELITKVNDCSEQLDFYIRSSDECREFKSDHQNTAVKYVVSQEGYAVCFVMDDDTLRCWGHNPSYGPLGYGDTTDRYLPSESPAAYRFGIQTRMGYKMLPAAGSYYNYAAVTKDGRVWMSGYNGRGLLGQGHTSSYAYFVPANRLDNVTSIVAGGWSTEAHYCALNGDGLMYCWGYNNVGQCGVGSTSNMQEPTRVLAIDDIKMIALSRSGGSSSSCAVRNNGDLWCWGYNGYGQLGNSNTNNRDAPVQVLGGQGTNDPVFKDVDYVKWHGGGSCSTMMALKKDGTVWMWGYGSHGQIGNGATSHQSRPTQVTNMVGQELKKITAIYPANGNRYSAVCALQDGTFSGGATGGVVWCWGYNGRGQLGLGNTEQKNRAYEVATLSSLKVDVVSLENPPNVDHSYAYNSVCALQKLSDGGNVYCWGFNNYGQLGQGDTSQRNAPVRVHDITRIRSLGSRMHHASSGDCTFYAVSGDGYTVWSWGYGGHGQPGSHTVPIGTNRIPQKVRLT